MIVVDTTREVVRRGTTVNIENKRLEIELQERHQTLEDLEEKDAKLLNCLRIHLREKDTEY
jgi:hypothetical protein